MAEYCLRWNNHQPNLVSVFSELLNAETLTDVTLAVDGNYIYAHKLVLSACSNYFKDLFAGTPCKHPIVIFKDVKIEDLKTVVDFVYRGEVNISQDRLQDVMKTGEMLKIKGLSENPKSQEDSTSHPLGSLSCGSQSSTRGRSSLTDSREHSSSLEDEKSESAPIAHMPKKRRLTPHTSSESTHDSREEAEPRIRSASDIKREESEEVELHLHEDSAAIKSESGSHLSGNASVEDVGEPSEVGSLRPSDISCSSQGNSRVKRGILQRQSGIIREAVYEDKCESSSSSFEHIRCSSEHRNNDADETYASDTAELITGDVGTSAGPCKSHSFLQVPQTVVVTPSDSVPVRYGSPDKFSSGSDHSSWSAGGTTITKQHSQPELSTSSLTIFSSRKDPPSVGTLTYSTSSGLDKGSSSNSNSLQVMHVLVKQRSSPSSLVHYPPIQPKKDGLELSEAAKKNLPVIQLTPSDDVVAPASRVLPRLLPRAVSEEPCPSYIDSGGLAPPPLVQSRSHDSGAEPVRHRLQPHGHLTTSGGATVTPAYPSHQLKLREGPPLGCNFCWNSTDSQGKVMRRKTKYYCSECRTNLCIVPCYQEYHRQMEQNQDNNKQIAKILTKNSSL